MEIYEPNQTAYFQITFLLLMLRLDFFFDEILHLLIELIRRFPVNEVLVLFEFTARSLPFDHLVHTLDDFLRIKLVRTVFKQIIL